MQHALEPTNVGRKNASESFIVKWFHIWTAMVGLIFKRIVFSLTYGLTIQH